MSETQSATVHVGTQDAQDHVSDYSAVQAVARRMLAMMGADTPVRVVAVNGTGVSPVGFVDVQPLVHMQDSLGRTLPHGVIRNVPYARIQGGASAVICDPCVGDIGAVIVCGRDIGNVKANRADSAPGSFRIHDMADAVYVAPILNAAPTEYIWLTSEGVRVRTSGTLQIDAASVRINCDVTTTGTITAQGDVTGEGISLSGHAHPVTSAPGTTGRPQ
ncbi:Gp138 family membrane-puncturing spike protein [Novacetimonas pomaceti]|uniref:Gp138 family membrane-puncturing spike protein n=1 Tax=Novacetimonas pomaceti TaxID=2021998 RepID=UPI001C2CDCFC|nr:Gp138 family membrane-puncturing spike protein [Novacetimonas pomaceti]MBV1834962.1 baseplate assembly protein [Novacetimonas pomaceti]